MKVALLGCGRVAEHYRRMLLELDPVAGLDVVGVCDLDPHQAERLAQAFACPVFPDLSALLARSGADVVFILTPSGDHFDHARQVLEHGTHVLCEKPVTMRPEEAETLAALAASQGRFCATVFQNRWNPALRAVRQAVEAGRLKTLVTANIRLQWCREQSYYDDGWHGTWAMDGGVINQQAIHHLDALQWICGPIEAVCAAATRRMNRLEAEDTLTAVLRFVNGALGTIEATTAARPRDLEASLSVVGEGGKIQVGGIALNRIDTWALVDATSEDATMAERCSVEVPSGYGLSHSPFLRDLVASFDSGRAPGVTIDSAMNTLRLVHALYVSVERGGWVRLDEGARSSRLGRRPA